MVGEIEPYTFKFGTNFEINRLSKILGHINDVKERNCAVM